MTLRGAVPAQVGCGGLVEWVTGEGSPAFGDPGGACTRGWASSPETDQPWPTKGDATSLGGGSDTENRVTAPIDCIVVGPEATPRAAARSNTSFITGGYVDAVAADRGFLGPVFSGFLAFFFFLGFFLAFFLKDSGAFLVGSEGLVTQSTTLFTSPSLLIFPSSKLAPDLSIKSVSMSLLT